MDRLKEYNNILLNARKNTERFCLIDNTEKDSRRCKGACPETSNNRKCNNSRL